MQLSSTVPPLRGIFQAYAPSETDSNIPGVSLAIGPQISLGGEIERFRPNVLIMKHVPMDPVKKGNDRNDVDW